MVSLQGLYISISLKRTNLDETLTSKESITKMSHIIKRNDVFHMNYVSKVTNYNKVKNMFLRFVFFLQSRIPEFKETRYRWYSESDYFFKAACLELNINREIQASGLKLEPNFFKDLDI